MTLTSQPKVIILAPLGRDAVVAASILGNAGISNRICPSLPDVMQEIHTAHCLIATDEALVNSDRTDLAAWLSDQPPWSDFPVVLLVMKGAEIDHRLDFLSRYVIVLERPLRASSLANAVQAAIRARERQLEVRASIEEISELAERQRLLIRELHHRVKNTLANVRAMLAITARSATNVDAFVSDFTARITSLANTHSMLTDDYWQTASLRGLLEDQMQPYCVDGKPRCDFSGPEVDLVADIAVPIGMAFHELATNSVKFGSLSRPSGRIDVEWRTEEVDDKTVVVLDWRERNGPEVKRPTHKGFGTVLLEKVVTVQCEAEIELDYAPEGFHMSLRLPLRERRLVPAYS